MAFEDDREPTTNDSGSKMLYDRRQEFKLLVYPPDIERMLIDMWYERPLYGKVDTRLNVVYPLEKSGLKQVPGSETLFAVDFVADAFLAMRDHFLNAVGKNKMSGQLGPIDGFQAKRAWVDPIASYENHIEVVKQVFLEEYLLPERNNIKEIVDILPLFERYLRDQAASYPLSLSGYIKSGFCPPRSSGLIIELLDSDHGNDQDKMEVVNSPDFEKYVSMASYFGFYVDKNAPWSLVGNLASTKMRKYMEVYGLMDANNYFSDYCWPAYLTEMQRMKDLLYDIFYAFELRSPLRKKEILCDSGKIKNKMIERKVLTLEENIAKIPEVYWFRLCIITKALEMDVEINEVTSRRLVQKAMYFYKKDKNHVRALAYINRFFKNRDVKANPVVRFIEQLRDSSEDQIKELFGDAVTITNGPMSVFPKY